MDCLLRLAVAMRLRLAVATRLRLAKLRLLRPANRLLPAKLLSAVAKLPNAVAAASVLLADCLQTCSAAAVPINCAFDRLPAAT